MSSYLSPSAWYTYFTETPKPQAPPPTPVPRVAGTSAFDVKLVETLVLIKPKAFENVIEELNEFVKQGNLKPSQQHPRAKKVTSDPSPRMTALPRKSITFEQFKDELFMKWQQRELRLRVATEI